MQKYLDVFLLASVTYHLPSVWSGEYGREGATMSPTFVCLVVGIGCGISISRIVRRMKGEKV